MKQELQDKLIKKYPFMKRKKIIRYNADTTTYDFYGIETEDGWYDLIDRLLSKIGPVNVHQIKEKFGALRFYCDPIAPIENSELYDEIHKAEAESTTICEQCGKPGKLRNKNGWFRTICDECTVIKKL